MPLYTKPFFMTYLLQFFAYIQLNNCGMHYRHILHVQLQLLLSYTILKRSEWQCNHVTDMEACKLTNNVSVYISVYMAVGLLCSYVCSCHHCICDSNTIAPSSHCITVSMHQGIELTTCGSKFTSGAHMMMIIIIIIIIIIVRSHQAQSSICPMHPNIQKDIAVETHSRRLWLDSISWSQLKG